MTKLEEILETKVPVVLNRSYIVPPEKPKEKVYPADIERVFKGREIFNLSDYEDLEEELTETDSYCLITKSGHPTLKILEALQTTPTGISYIELRVSKCTRIPISVFLVISGETLIMYTPIRGNAIRSDNGMSLGDNGIFDFKWEDKNILEKSDLLYITKDINRPSLSKYLLRDIYEAFQEYNSQGAEGIIMVDSLECASEISEVFVVCSNEL